MSNQSHNELEALRAILLADDRTDYAALKEKVEFLKAQVEPDKLKSLAGQEVDEKLVAFKSEIPNELGPVITETLKRQIAESQDTVVAALYPIMGKMIKKYLQAEMEKLSESIDARVNSLFSFQGIKRKVAAVFGGSRGSDLIMENLIKAEVVDVFLIEKPSGLLIASSNKESTVQKDMVAGMLTAIKSFVEDAFQQQNEILEVIEYETYKIQIGSFPIYNIALIINGPLTSTAKDQLTDQMNDCAEKLSKLPNLQEKSAVEKVLTQCFQ